ncbi:phosphoribosylformylglycinamidine synthase subunit PurQ [Thermodesulfobacteriota bacterium]
MKPVRALVLTGYGLNCDYETDYSLKLAGAESHRVHINDFIEREISRSGNGFDHYHILIFGGGFSWADDHGAGVILGSKMKFNLGERVEDFIDQGKLIIGICNGFQTLVNFGLLPAFERKYQERRVALTYNDSGNFIDTWVKLKVNPASPCVFTRSISSIDLPVRHGEGKFYASYEDLDQLVLNGQVVMQYADEEGHVAQGRWPLNPNGSLMDIAGICDPTGRIFGLMPHPEAYNHYTNHPQWVHRKMSRKRRGQDNGNPEGDGIRIFRNAVEFVTAGLKNGTIKV